MPSSRDSVTDADPRALLNRLRFDLRWVNIRLTARKGFDLTQFGTGAGERIASATILAAAFAVAAFAVAVLATGEKKWALAGAGVAFASTMIGSTFLVLLGSDAGLADRRAKLRAGIPEMEELAAKQRANEPVVRRGEVPDEPSEPVRTRRPQVELCPYCDEPIRVAAVKCKHCGEYLDSELRAARRPSAARRSNPGVAAVLSFLFPGLGQLYKAQVLGAFVWWVATMIGYACCVVPGLFLHLICIFDAASDNGAY